MFYKIGKVLFRFVLNSVNFFRLLLVFWAFFTLVYWLFQLGGNPFVVQFAPLFEPVRDFIHIFYTRVATIDKVSIDFSFLLAAILMFLTVWGLKFVVEYIELAERKYDSIYRYIKNKAEELFNLNLEAQYLSMENKNNKLLFLIKFSANNAAKDSFFNRDFEMGVEEKEKEILLAFLKGLDISATMQKRFLNEGVLLYFEDFNDIERILAALKSNIMNLQRIYAEQKWGLTSLISIEAYAENKDIEAKLKNLIMLNSLNQPDQILCSGAFKQRYSLIHNPKLIIEDKGFYKLAKGGEEVYSIKA